MLIVYFLINKNFMFLYDIKNGECTSLPEEDIDILLPFLRMCVCVCVCVCVCACVRVCVRV